MEQGLLIVSRSARDVDGIPKSRMSEHTADVFARKVSLLIAEEAAGAQITDDGARVDVTEAGFVPRESRSELAV